MLNMYEKKKLRSARSTLSKHHSLAVSCITYTDTDTNTHAPNGADLPFWGRSGGAAGAAADDDEQHRTGCDAECAGGGRVWGLDGGHGQQQPDPHDPTQPTSFPTVVTCQAGRVPPAGSAPAGRLPRCPRTSSPRRSACRRTCRPT